MAEKPPCRFSREVYVLNLQILLDAVGGSLRLGGDGNGKLQVVLVAEAVQPLQKVLYLNVVLAGDDLAQIVHKDMGNVVVACVQAADKALERLEGGQIEIAGLDETDMIVDVVDQFRN